MRQRVLIAIAFACRPKLIIADEPTTALDVTVQKQVLRLLKALQATHGSAILFITHDLGVVAKVCDTVSVIHAGASSSRPRRQLFASPAHPYTRALFAATPRYDRPGDALAPIPEALTHRSSRRLRASMTQAGALARDERKRRPQAPPYPSPARRFARPKTSLAFFRFLSVSFMNASLASLLLKQ